MEKIFSSPFIEFILICAALLSIRYFMNRSSTPPRPPGPKALPIIGNIHQLPTEKEWLTYSEWADTYGEIMSVKALGQSIVILNSSKVAVELLDKRSQIYSGRPELIMLGELMGWNNTLGLSPYGERFKEYRRLLHRFMGTKSSIEGFAPLQERETHSFLRLVLKDPEHIPEHIRRNAGAIILMMTYGYTLNDFADPFIKIVDKATWQFGQASAPGAFLVDALPILRYVPECFPGAGWKKKARTWRETLYNMADLPYDFARRTLTEGVATPSYATDLLERKTLISSDEEHAIKWSAASLYSGGADTSVSTVHSFVLAMTLYPDKQKRAQAEIDTVVGPHRLPSLTDRPNLPYVEAVLQEVLRWNPVTPLGLPHRASQNDVYNGYLIPEGSLVIFNAWKFLHDPSVYANPMEFNPERFLRSDGHVPETDPRSIVFGYGRRTCPGLHIADTNIFIAIAMLLSVFDIRKEIVDSREVDPVVDYTSGGISHPKPFKCAVKPRSAEAEALINAEGDN